MALQVPHCAAQKQTIALILSWYSLKPSKYAVPHTDIVGYPETNLDPSFSAQNSNY